MVRLTASTLLLFALVSCGRSGSHVQTNIQSSIEANAESTTHTDWETSDYHPKFLFENVRQDISEIEPDEIANADKIRNEMCVALKNLSDDNLLIFENEVLNDENSDVLKFCKKTLLNRLSDKNKLNRQDFKYATDAMSDEPSLIDFKIETKSVDDEEYLNFNKYASATKDKEIILTFDDGPHDLFTASILKTLKAAGDAKAMFFELGKQIKKYPATTKNVDDDGHVVANHSWSHRCLNNTEVCRKNNKGVMLTDSEVSSEIVDTFNLIKKTIGKINPFFRFPYGDNRASTSEYLKKSGVLEMHWSIDSNDWRYTQKVGSETIPFTSKEVMASALRTIDKNNRGVVLFHDIHRRSAEILPQFLFELYKRKFKLVILEPKVPEVDVTTLHDSKSDN